MGLRDKGFLQAIAILYERRVSVAIKNSLWLPVKSSGIDSKGISKPLQTMAPASQAFLKRSSRIIVCSH